MGGLLESGGNLIGGFIDADNARDRKKEAKRDYWARLEAMNLNPNQVSEQAPAYQQTKSPVARAYLESFLTGNNADAVQGTRLGGTAQKADVGARFNQAYGGWDKLQKQQNADLADNSRFQPKPINFDADPVRDELAQEKVKNPKIMDYERKLGRPLTAAEAKIVNDGHLKSLGGGSTFFVYEHPKAGGGDRGGTTLDSKEAIENWLQSYGGQ